MRPDYSSRLPAPTDASIMSEAANTSAGETRNTPRVARIHTGVPPLAFAVLLIGLSGSRSPASRTADGKTAPVLYLAFIIVPRILVARAQSTGETVGRCRPATAGCPRHTNPRSRRSSVLAGAGAGVAITARTRGTLSETIKTLS